MSVLVPVLDEAAHIREALAAMLAQRVEGQVEVLLADGGSRDGTRELLAELAAGDTRVRLLDNPRGWTPSGLNVCLRHARGEFVARMDAHSVYPESYLQDGIDRLRAGDADWVSGPQVVVGNGLVQRAFGLALRTPLGRGGSRRWAPQGSEMSEWELDSGVFTGVWRREQVVAIGGWDERWWRNQDAEMAARFMERGSRLVCRADMAASYAPRDSLDALRRQYDGYGYYRAATARRHPTTLRRSALLMPLLACCAPATVVGTRRTRRLARIGLAAYVATIASAGVSAAREGDTTAAATVPVVLATMHFAAGVGFLRGMARFGIPWAALARISGSRMLQRLAPSVPGEPVYAPSLRDC